MEVFTISPASSKPFWILTVVCALLVLVLIALAFTAYSSRHLRVEVDDRQLIIGSQIWGREIPLRELDIANARKLSISKGSELAPRWRTFGTSLPGYSTGWFRLRNGDKALLYLTRHHDIVHIPAYDGYALMLSVDEPDRFIELLQNKS